MYQVLTVIRASVHLAKQPREGGDINILFWCRSGRHRSVVMVQLLRAVMEDLQYQVTDSSS